MPKTDKKPAKPAKPAKTKPDKRLAAATETIAELSDQVVRLRARAKAAEAEVEVWRKKAEKQRSRVQKVRREAEKAIAKASKASTAAAGRAGRKAKAKAGGGPAGRLVVADHPRAEPLALKDAPALPEPTWTVAQLRAAAREQGVPGYSRLRKDQLLAALV